MDTEEGPRDHGGRGWRGAATSPAWPQPRGAWSPQSRKTRQGPSPSTFKGGQPCPHADFGFPASRLWESKFLLR